MMSEETNTFPEGVTSTVEPEDIYWVMPWKSKYNKEDREDELMFEEEGALALMLINEVVFLNSYWWKFRGFGGEPIENPRWTEDESKLISVFVNCNDVFAWGCSDAEDLPHNEIKNLYDHYIKDPHWGSAVWCCKQRKQMPQKPVADRIRKAGIWDLDSMGLEPNYYDEALKEMNAKKKEEEGQK